MPDPKPEVALHLRPEWIRVTLASIGDAVITTDTQGRVTFLNPVAQSLTGWTQEEAAGISVETVFKIVHSETRMFETAKDGILILDTESGRITDAKPYAARFEVWFKPDSGQAERKIAERNFKIVGWQR